MVVWIPESASSEQAAAAATSPLKTAYDSEIESGNEKSHRASSQGRDLWIILRSDFLRASRVAAILPTMRLLNVRTLEFEEFFGSDVPVYAILSHRWLPAAQESSYKDFRKGHGKNLASHRKVVKCCDFVKTRDFIAWNEATGDNEIMPIEWVWIDTICIDKRSSAELSEAINSMYGTKYSWRGNESELTVRTGSPGMVMRKNATCTLRMCPLGIVSKQVHNRVIGSVAAGLSRSSLLPIS